MSVTRATYDRIMARERAERVAHAAPFNAMRAELAGIRHAAAMRDGSEYREEAYACLIDAFRANRADILAAREV